MTNRRVRRRRPNDVATSTQHLRHHTGVLGVLRAAACADRGFVVAAHDTVIADLEEGPVASIVSACTLRVDRHVSGFGVEVAHKGRL
ncbi:hypothetical protein AB0C34_23170 [Nocardia sp. NPDC049220]|uniref:hypothetical protein n=1 Tax=Nocardia sp. NPDC049220 TaxID=3155273 RepID=UPI0033D85162